MTRDAAQTREGTVQPTYVTLQSRSKMAYIGLEKSDEQVQVERSVRLDQGRTRPGLTR